MTGRPDDEHVTEALVEDQLGGYPAVAAAEQRRGGLLTFGQAGSVRDTLAGVCGLAGDEALVTLFECFPRSFCRSRP
jgi:hypothetical protein